MLNLFHTRSLDNKLKSLKMMNLPCIGHDICPNSAELINNTRIKMYSLDSLRKKNNYLNILKKKLSIKIKVLILC